MTRDHMKMLMNVAITASNTQVWTVTEEQLEKFAELVVAAEREQCALVAESYEPTCESCPSGVTNAIRARGHVNEPAKSLTRFNDMLKENGIKWEVEP